MRMRITEIFSEKVKLAIVGAYAIMVQKCAK
jgi:hypothetical protein